MFKISKSAKIVELTPAQQQAAFKIANAVEVLQGFAEGIEEDSKDGLSNSEKLEIVFAAPSLIAGATDIIKAVRYLKKENADVQTSVVSLVAETLADGVENTASRVELTFNYAAQMGAVAAKVTNQTRAYIKAMKAARQENQGAEA